MNKLERSKGFWSLVIYIPVAVAILWVLFGVFGEVVGFSSEWDETFENFNVGTINGQGKWTASDYPNNYTVSISNPYGGIKHLKILNTSAEWKSALHAFEADTKIESGIVEFTFRIQMTHWVSGSCIANFGFQTEGRTQIIGVQMIGEANNTFRIQRIGGSDMFPGKKLILNDSWATIKIMVNLDTKYFYVDVNYKGENWTQYKSLQITLDHIKELGIECYNCGVDFDSMNQTFPAPRVWAVSPDFENNLSGLWRFDEGSGNIAHDTSGNGNDGTLINMEEEDWVAGVVETCLDFDGIDDEVACGNIGDLGNTYSVSLWFIFPEIPDTQRVLWSCQGSLSYPYIAQQTNGAINFYSHATHSASPATLVPNTWYHFVFVVEGSKVTIYKNNELYRIKDFGGADINGNFSDFTLGDNAYHDEWKGKVDELRIYDRILTINEISALHKNPGGEIINLETTFEFGWENLYNDDSLSVAFYNRPTGIFSQAKAYEIETIGGAGTKELSFSDFNFDRNGKFYFYAITSKYIPTVIEGMYLTGGYSYEWSGDLVDPEYWITILLEGLVEIFEMSDFETWYSEESKFATPTAMFVSITGFFEPIFNKIGEFGSRIVDYFNVNEAYNQGYGIGKAIPYFSFFVGQTTLFLGGFPILKWLFIVILLLVGIFIFRLILKFIPGLG